MRSLKPILALSAALVVAGCESPPDTPAAVTAKAAAAPRYVQTGTRLSTDHPQAYPGIGVMSQGALQDATGDHTGPGYDKDLLNPQ
jgi:hypothetical protein